MPVDRMTGFFSAATRSRYGRFVISPEGILYTGRSSDARKSTLARSNGVDR
jgi:hypothetical protein